MPRNPCIYLFLFVGLLFGGDSANPVRIELSFDRGAVNQKVRGFDAGGGTTYTKEQAYRGQAAKCTAKRGKENFGRWGGRAMFPRKLRKGEEMWWRVRTFWPKGMDYSANPRLKFLRIHTAAANGKNRGYNDIYMNGPGHANPFCYIYEGAHRWTRIGTSQDAVKPDTWETYEYYICLDDVPASQGGKARIRFWKDGKLLADIKDRKTLAKPDDYADAALLFTYWNSSPYIGQVVVGTGHGFKVGQKVKREGTEKPVFNVTKVMDDAIYMVDPEIDWRKRARPWSVLRSGQVLTGNTSRKSSTIKQMLHTHPTMDISMYIDDFLFTTEKPKKRDAKGNPCIGM